MNDPRRNLIDDLVADLNPVERPGRIGRAVLGWLAVAIAYSITILLATGPLRPGALADLVAYPAFAIETLIAVAAIGALATATLALAIPGRGRPGHLIALPLVLLGVWVGFYLVGLLTPAHPVSMLGKREHCLWQGILFSLPNLFVLLAIARRFQPLWPRITAAVAGLAAGAIPAALMQFGCMYVPGHILTHHIGPVLLSALIGAIAGPLVLNRRRTVPRNRGVSVH
jgi:hypothetical protein